MPTNRTGTGAPATIVSGATSPLTLSIEPSNEPVVLVITSASAITVTGQSSTRPIDIAHTS